MTMKPLEAYLPIVNDLHFFENANGIENFDFKSLSNLRLDTFYEPS